MFASAAADHELSLGKEKALDHPAGIGRSRRGTVGGDVGAEALLDVLHVPEKVRTDMDGRGADGEVGDLALEQPGEGEMKVDALDGDDLGQRIIRGEDVEAGTLHDLILRSEAVGGLGEGEVLQGGVEGESDVGNFRAFVVEPDGHARDVEQANDPRRLRQGGGGFRNGEKSAEGFADGEGASLEGKRGNDPVVDERFEGKSGLHQIEGKEGRVGSGGGGKIPQGEGMRPGGGVGR